MKTIISLLLCILLQFMYSTAYCQEIKFNHVFSNNNSGFITTMAQDQQGYMWFINQNLGLQRYDGIEFKTYVHDPKDPNSLAGNYGECLWVDSLDMIWIGTWGAGLDRFDPSTNVFAHFRHNPKDLSSISSDTVAAVLRDHLGNLWVGTTCGLDLLDKKTGKFQHFTNNPDDPASLSYNRVRVIYEDMAGTLWVGCGRPFLNPVETLLSGGLNRLDRKSGKFTRYIHDPDNPASIANNGVRSMLEDSKGNFWVGTGGDGLHTLNRETGVFTHFYYDSTHPEKLSRPFVDKSFAFDHIPFIKEDVTGAIWIGSTLQGINRYDPESKKITHYGNLLQRVKGKVVYSYKDTTSGFNDNSLWGSMISRAGLIWFWTLNGNIYSINPIKTTIPFYPINNGLMGNTFYPEENGNILWIGTDKGLIRKNLNDQTQKIWLHDSLNVNSLSGNNIAAMRADGEGRFWMATDNGLCKFDPVANVFTTFRHSEKNKTSLSSNKLSNLCIDGKNNIWIATEETGIDKMDTKTGEFTNYHFKPKETSSLASDHVICVTPGPDNEIWVGTYGGGLNRLNQDNGKFRYYLNNSIKITSIVFDASGVAWAGAPEGLYYFDKASDQFLLFVDPISRKSIENVLHILEDDKNNLWVSTSDAIVKINEKRNDIKRYGINYGIHKNTFVFSDNIKSKNGQLFFGDQTGYYAFFPDQLKDTDAPPIINFTSFKLGDQEITAKSGSVLNAPIWKTNEIKLNFNQNVFSFDFVAISYTDPGDKKYMFMLENYDNTWHPIGIDHKAYFFNVPPGKYIFHARGVNSSGVWGEKKIRIFILPPWWKTWWAYSIFGLLFISLIAGFISYRSRALRRENRILEERVSRRTEQLKQSIEDLKSTQSQLIQSEKMASLGELTAGIAHEIQNPLNFVNNFSDVNTELIYEMQQEIDKGNLIEAKAISNDIKDNEEKINHHGKRADAIVKGMLQHSRTSYGVKEPTDINVLAEEYLRLAYHGLRAKDKTFNVTMKTDFDETIGKINIIPQDIGRVILNLITNAFYAVTEKKQQLAKNLSGLENLTGLKGYEPNVWVSTKKLSNSISISVRDNGNGIPQKNLDKIFQPFFTTKPTGQGTGLGLSLSYDIVKAHSGKLKVETKVGDGSEFIIQLYF